HNVKGGEDLEKEILRSSDGGEIIMETKTFDTRITDFFYIEDTTKILIRTNDQIWKSDDEGRSWKLIEQELKGKKVLAMIKNRYFTNHIYFITQSDEQYYTTDAGENIKPMKVPKQPNTFGIPILDFHPKKEGWLIYTSSEKCDETSSSECAV
ncbi:11696_t:CDS:2, partial [Cetraspora pellucida]